jgi:hypothetical protein
VAITLPDGDDAVRYRILATVRFEDQRFEWTDGPFEGAPGAFVEWEIQVPDHALMVDGQVDYLSDLIVVVEILHGEETLARGSAGYARVAFEPGAPPLVLTREQAAELAPGDAWGEDAEPRVLLVDRASDPPPATPEHDGSVSHSEEVDG